MPTMAGPSFRSCLAALPLQGAALALLLAPVADAASAAVTGAELATAVSAATGQLRQSWAADSTTAALPFPSVRLLPAASSVDGICDPKASPRRPAPTAAWCASSGEVLLDRDLLADATAKLSGPELRIVVTYWVSMGLAERLLPAMSTDTARGTAPRALGTLQANCIGGVLIGSSAARPSGAANPLLIAARAAYGDSHRAAVGTASQRGYALLTGLGATDTASCASDAMAALGRGSVPDPALLRQIEELPPPDRAHSSLMKAVNSQCQPLPSRPCPRPIASAWSPR